MSVAEVVWIVVGIALGVPVVIGLGMIRGNARADQIRTQQHGTDGER